VIRESFFEAEILENRSRFMGEVLRFHPRQEGRNRTKFGTDAGPQGGDGAEIILFLGVRYQRHDGDNAIASKGRSKRGKNRKRA
jgi:hypothetical protein